MDLEFLSPKGAFVALLVVVPLAAVVLVQRRAAAVREVLGLREPTAQGYALLPLAVAATLGLVALAAAQPVLREVEDVEVREDVEALYVVDTSRSMLAAAAPGEPTRFARARAAAMALHDATPAVPAGVGSLTDRLLPHLLPTGDAQAFSATMGRALAPGRPGSIAATNLGTDFGALAALADRHFYSDSVERRVAVILSDGETTTFDAGKLRAALETAGVELVFVRIWQPRERVYGPRGLPEAAYRPSPESGRALRLAAATLGAPVYEEARLQDAAAAVQAAAGEGPTATAGRREDVRPLAPYAAAGALLPLALVLWRRNRG